MAEVLVVDDSSNDRQKVGGLLTADGGFRVHFANSGRAALEHIRGQLPDVVLTDLSMRDMDGLELVAQIKSRHPLLPVVLMTSKGSEEVALRALHHGAASYVPKQFLKSALAMTLRDVLSAACRDGGNARLMHCMTKDECAFTLVNDPGLIPPLVSYLQHRVIEIGVTEESERMRVAVGLEEALVNAVYHGNLELSSKLRDEDPVLYEQVVAQRCGEPPYCSRRVFVEAKLSRQSLMFVIRDEGPGFDPHTLPDPTAPANLERVSGRGVFLMRTFMDEVHYNATGNQVTLIKHRAKAS
ncbi:MAG TPA: response regulator [Pirellulaceae bacterium]|nr:response regulator [Pirellulaceae bacterium]